MVGPAGELCKMQDLSTAENQILSGKIHRAHVQGCSVRGIHMPCTALLRQGRKLLPPRAAAVLAGWRRAGYHPLMPTQLRALLVIDLAPSL